MFEQQEQGLRAQRDQLLKAEDEAKQEVEKNVESVRRCYNPSA
jgi:hypothetical protein